MHRADEVHSKLPFLASVYTLTKWKMFVRYVEITLLRPNLQLNLSTYCLCLFNSIPHTIIVSERTKMGEKCNEIIGNNVRQMMIK